MNKQANAKNTGFRPELLDQKCQKQFSLQRFWKVAPEVTYTRVLGCGPWQGALPGTSADLVARVCVCVLHGRYPALPAPSWTESCRVAPFDTPPGTPTGRVQSAGRREPDLTAHPTQGRAGRPEAPGLRGPVGPGPCRYRTQGCYQHGDVGALVTTREPRDEAHHRHHVPIHFPAVSGQGTRRPLK